MMTLLSSKLHPKPAETIFPMERRLIMAEGAWKQFHRVILVLSFPHLTIAMQSPLARVDRLLRYISPVLAFGTERRYLTKVFLLSFADRTESLTRK